MRTSTRLLLNSIANLVSGLTNTALALLLTPILLHYFDRSAFGVWLLAAPLSLYAPLIFLGISAAVTRFVAADLAREDYDSMNAYVNTALIYFRVGTGLLLIFGVTLAFLLPKLTRIDPALQGVASQCVIVLTVCQGVAFFFGPISGVLQSLERFDLISLSMVCSRVIRLAAICIAVIVFKPSPPVGLLILAIIMGSTDAGPVVVNAYHARARCPGLRINLRLARWDRLWPMISFGIRTLLWSALSFMMPYTSLFIIGRYMSSADVADYGVPEQALTFVNSIVNMLVTSTGPVAAKLSARNSAEDLQALLLRSAKYTMGIALAASLGLGLLGPVVLKLWVGERFLRVAPLLLVLSVGWCLWAVQASSFNVLFGMERQGGLGIIGLICVIVIGVAGGFILGVFNGGLMSMALLKSAVLTVGCGIAMPLYACRYVNVRVWAYLRSVYGRAILAVLPMAAYCLVLRFVPLRYAWWVLAAGVGGGALLALIGFWVLLFDTWDRAFFRERLGALRDRLWRRNPAN